jgi:hypothetical protein
MKNAIRISLPLMLLVLAFSCRKVSDTELEETLSAVPPPTPTAEITFVDTTVELKAPQTVVKVASLSCPNAPDYGDTIVFSKWVGILKDFKIKPLNYTSGGTYFSIPQGMVINKNTGEINVSKSEKGIRYLVGFVKNGTKDTCFSKLIIAGITYVDSIYVMERNDTLAIPYYNANPNTPVFCNNSDDTDYPDLGSHGDVTCEFDDDADLDGYGLFDQPLILTTLNGLLVRVRTISGVLNLKKTLQGAFGLLPLNGMKINVLMHYRLNDGSGRVLQKIPLQIIYYRKASDVPKALREDISAKRSSFYAYDQLSPSQLSISMKPRPPQIVITRFAD